MSFEAPQPTKSIAERLCDLRRAFGSTERTLPLLESILSSVAEDVLIKIQSRDKDWIELNVSGAQWFKYLDTVYWTYHSILLAEQLGLDTAPPMNILDLGCGPGHFSLVCSHLGHDVTSIDVDTPLHDLIAGALRVERLMIPILSDHRIPDLGKKFDLVTAMATMFNTAYWQPSEVSTWSPRGPWRYWTLAEWEFLLSDLMDNQLAYPGRLFFDLNQETHGNVAVFNMELLDFCAENGAEVVRDRGRIDWKLSEPISFD